MSNQETGQRNQDIKISPQVKRHIDVLNLAQRIAQHKFGTSIDGLRQEGKPTKDYSKIQEVISEASRIVGPEDQFVDDYQIWRETGNTGSHEMDFHEWRLAMNEAYKTEYERLSKELGENK